MSAELQIGTAVKYKSDDGKTKTGVIHGVRKVQLPDGSDSVLSYLVDTGDNVRVDTYHRNYRDEEIGRRLSKMGRKDSELFTDQHKLNKALSTIQVQKDLPADTITVEEVRQPEQLDIRPGDLEPV